MTLDCFSLSQWRAQIAVAEEHTRLACWFRRLAETGFDRLFWNRRVSDLSLLNRGQTHQIPESSYFFLLPSYRYHECQLLFLRCCFLLSSPLPAWFCFPLLCVIAPAQLDDKHGPGWRV